MAEEMLPGQEKPETKIPTFPEVGETVGVNFLEILSIAAAAFAIIAAIVFVVLQRSAANQLQVKTQELQDLESQLKTPDLAVADLRAQKISKSVSTLQTALKQKVYWSKLFDDLKINSLRSVKYNNFSVDDKGVVKIDGEANAYSDVAKFLAGLRNSLKLADVTLISATSATTPTAGGKILFSAQGKINPAELK